MKVTLTAQKKQEFEQMHDCGRDDRVHDPIKTVLFALES